MPRACAMGVVHDERTAQRVAVVEDDRAARVAQLWRVRMSDRPAVGSLRLAGDRADRIQIVDRVVHELEPRCADHEFPEVPRLLDHQAEIDIGQSAELLSIEQGAQRQHRWAESELQIHGRSHLPILAAPQDAPRFFQIAAHRLLHQDRRSVRQFLENPDNLIAGHGKVENRALDRRRLLERLVHARNAERCSRLPGGLGADVVVPRDRVVESARGRHMCCPDDAAGAAHDAGPWLRGPRPGLGQIGTQPANANTDPRLSGPRLTREAGARRPRPGTGSWTRVSRRSEPLRGIVEFW